MDIFLIALKLLLWDHISIITAIVDTISMEVPLLLVYLLAIGLQHLCVKEVF